LNKNIEGQIDVRFTPGLNGRCAVEISSSRPQLAQKLMVGCSPEQAAERAGLIFSLCGKAQRIAAEAACEAAQDLQPDAALIAQRERRVLQELAQEHVWQWLLNWPQKAGHPPAMRSLLALRTASDFAVSLEQIVHEEILGEAPELWLTRDLAAFDAWSQRGATLPAAIFNGWVGEGDASDAKGTQAALLPPLHQISVAQCIGLAQRALVEEDFCAQPTWVGAPAETGAMARCQHHPMLAAWLVRRGRGAGARLLARLIELAEMPRRLQTLQTRQNDGEAVVKAMPLAENVGMAAIETSRGLLIHVVRLAQGRVADYRIVAPTEWNFHPTGPLAQALSNLKADDDVLARAQILCQSLDPCVAFDVEMNHA
jgi:hypothetical protein